MRKLERTLCGNCGSVFLPSFEHSWLYLPLGHPSNPPPITHYSSIWGNLGLKSARYATEPAVFRRSVSIRRFLVYFASCLLLTLIFGYLVHLSSVLHCMYLQDLSSEVLALIFDGDFSCLVLMLWKCGNSQLNNKFRYGGVTSMKLEHNRYNGTSRWPRCLKEFSLTSLSIRCINRALCTTASLRRELQQLHGGLKKLEIEAEHVLGAFFPSFDASLISAAVPHHLNSNCSDATATLPGNSNLTELWDLNTTWPYMEELSIHDEVHPALSSHPTHPDIFGRLPRSLHTFILTMAQDFIVDAYRHYYQLPPKLSKLSIHTRRFELEPIDIRNLPTSLTEISCRISNSAARDLSRMPSLLPNLACISMDYAYWLSHDSWPSALERLHSRDARAERFFQGPPLPSKLKTLSLKCEEAKFLISSSEQMRKLPSSLNSLSTEALDFAKIDLDAWPPNLNFLQIHDYKYGSHWHHKLPRTLTSMSALLYGSRDCHSSTTAIETLIEHGVRSLQDTDDKELWSVLKPKLRDRDFVGGDASAYIEAVESGRLFGLPLRLTNLCSYVSGFHSSESLPMVLPPQLTSLEMSDVPWTFSEWENFFSLVPPSLTEIKVEGQLEGLRDCVAHWNEESRDPTTTPLYGLTNLTQIFFYPESGTLNGIGKYLPRNLRDLSLNADAAFDVVQDLPPHLVALTLYDEVELDDRRWPELLPRSLTSLVCYKGSIYGSDLAKLPPNLVLFRGGLHEVTLDQLLQIPRGLSLMARFRRTAPPTSTGASLTAAQLGQLFDAYQPLHVILEASRSSIEMELAVDGNYDPLLSDIDPRTIRRVASAHLQP